MSSMRPVDRSLNRRHLAWTGLTVILLAGVLAPVLQAGLPREQRGRGAGELSLDAAAVLAVVQTAVPEELQVVLPRAGTVTLAIDPPPAIRFVDGGVAGTFRLSVPALRWSSEVRVRYEPQVRARDGVVRLKATSAEPDVYLPVGLDLAPLLPAADLPRTVGWTLSHPDGRPFDVRCDVQGVRVDEDRLVIELGVAARPGR